MSAVLLLISGNFVRVREDADFWRAGMDGMVIEDYGDEVALVFGTDRYNHFQNAICAGPELWKKSELDMATACR